MYNERKQIGIPEEKLKETIDTSMRILRKRKRKKTVQRILITAGSLAAVFVCTLVVCLANPVMASRLPLIGNIFAQIEKDIPFSGDYSHKAQKLIPQEGSEEEAVPQEYSTADREITLTASEVFCDGTSLFITVAVERPDSLGIMWGYAENYENLGDETGELDQIMFSGSYSMNGGEKKEDAFQLEGRQVNDTTFMGVMKVNLMDPLAPTDQPNDINVSIQGINWLDSSNTVVSDATKAQEGICMFRGNWELTLPVAVDNEEVQTYPINETNGDGIGIQEVLVTPYEVKVTPIEPQKTPEERQRIYEAAKAQAEEALGKEAASEFYADAYLDREEDMHLGVAVFDQDGVRIRWEEDMGRYETYALKERKISKLYLYVMIDDITAIKARDQETAMKCAVFAKELDLEP